MIPRILLHRGVDIIVTHAPVRGFGDEEHISHRGFQTFVRLLNRCKPRYWAYGHVHMNYGMQHQRIIQHKDTTLINAFERYIIEVEPVKQRPYPFFWRKHS